MITVRTEFGFDPKYDWILAQQAQTMNLERVSERTNSIPEERP